MLKQCALLFAILWGWFLPAFAISFELLDQQNRFQSSEQWQGKPTLIFIWKSDCPACQQELTDIARLAQTLPTAHLLIVTTDKWSESLPKLSALPKNVTLLRSLNTESLLRRLGNKTGGIPYSVLLSLEQDVTKKHLGIMTFAQMQEWLN
ncbi:MAG: redoxin domain-containing protein [Moraxella osloensis]|nr:redoxin domain-containing protein [Moraxella osloensis]MBD3767879.1 redoxin domain-containing protein [Gammaproteobacteria bacterium]